VGSDPAKVLALRRWSRRSRPQREEIRQRGKAVMEKKKKLKIDELKVETFVTTLDDAQLAGVQGAQRASTSFFCDTTDGGCNTTSGAGICGSWGVTKCVACDGGSYLFCSNK
jgi:hypothetical protein